MLAGGCIKTRQQTIAQQSRGSSFELKINVVITTLLRKVALVGTLRQVGLYRLGGLDGAQFPMAEGMS
jgi:hypothetical protein